MNKKVVFVSLTLVIVLALAWYLVSPIFRPIVVEESFPHIQEPENSSEEESVISVVKESSFVASAHEVEGKALLIQEDDSYTIRFEDFETVNGPNLHIYLSSDLEGEDYIDLGVIRSTKGSANYEVPLGTDLETYNKVLVWCVPFEVLFSYSDLG